MLVALAILFVQWSAVPPASPTVGTALLEAAPGQTLRYTMGENVEVANVGRDGISSAEVNLRKTPGRLNGSVGSASVTVRLEPNRLDGRIGEDPIGLDVVRSGGGLQIMGRFGMRAIALEVRPSRIDGQVGPCFFHLEPDQGIYLGQVGCGGPPREVRLSVPVSLVARPDDELAAMLVALLAR